jgi:hypothetical protein
MPVHTIDPLEKEKWDKMFRGDHETRYGEKTDPAQELVALVSATLARLGDTNVEMVQPAIALGT